MSVPFRQICNLKTSSRLPVVVTHLIEVFRQNFYSSLHSISSLSLVSSFVKVNLSFRSAKRNGNENDDADDDEKETQHHLTKNAHQCAHTCRVFVSCVCGVLKSFCFFFFFFCCCTPSELNSNSALNE